MSYALIKVPGKVRLSTREKFSLKQQKIGSAISSGLTGVVGQSGRDTRDQMRGIGTFAGGTVNDYRSLAGTNYAQADNVAVSLIAWFKSSKYRTK